MARRSDCGLQVRVGTDLGTLADDLAQRLSHSPLAVFEPELVVVPTPGIRQWLEARLARTLGAALGEDGISSNVDFVFFDGLLRRVLGRGRREEDPWSLDRLTLLAIDLLLDADDDAPIARLRPAAGAPGVFDAARSAADLFDQLFRWRPDVAERWLADPSSDPRAPLLGAVATRIGTPVPWRAATERLEQLVSGDDADLDLPARLHLFGGDSLPGGPLLPQLLDALGAVRDVCMHVVVASVPRFDEVRRNTASFGPLAPERTSTDADGDEHPLLRTWGTPGRETAMLLAQLPDRPTTSVAAVDGTPATTSLLGTLRRSIRGEVQQPATHAHDRSIEVHGCVGERRQVEVLRDAVLHALVDEPSLRPRDVVVLCPDLPRFAPHLEAVLGDPQGAPLLPYVLTDRSLARAVPLVASTSRALGLLGGRYARSAVLDLLRDPFVQTRFALSEEDVERFGEWTDNGVVRWGLDGSHREWTHLPASFEDGTWRRALDRLLVGTALPAGAIAPALDVRALDPGYDVERVGALCSVVATLATLEDESATPRSIDGWCAFVRDLANALFDAGFEGSGQLERLHRVLAQIDADAEGLEAPLPFFEWRDLFDDRASDQRTRTANGPGGVTVTSLVPLRNVPFDVVAVLGMDERALQRTASVDVAFGPARVGDRDPRADVRAALLGAILAARTRLIVTHEFADVVTNQEVPSSTALSELLEVIDVVCDGGAAEVSFRHPRHAHGVDDLVADPRLGDEPFTFDRGALARAEALRSPRSADEDAAAAPRATPTGEPLPAAELVAFLNAPQRTYLRETLGVWVPNPSELPGDELATSLGALEKWGVTSDLVVKGSESMPVDEFEAATWDAYLTSWASAPDSPVAGLAGRLASDALRGRSGAGTRAAELLKHLRGKEKGRDATPRECRAELRDGTVVSGAPHVYGDDTTIRWTASGDEGRVRLASTIDLLVLTAQFPEVPWKSIRIWRKGNVAASKTGMVTGSSAEERRAVAVSSLERLVELRAIGLTAPIPLFGRVTAKLLATLEDRPDATPGQLIVSGLAGWTIFNGFGDGDEAAVKYCFPVSYEAVSALPRKDGDPVPAHDAGSSRMLAFSLTVCEALLDLSPVDAR